MTVKAGWSTPLLHVRNVERSLRFYELLGFETMDVELDGGTVVWARAHCEGGALMFLRSEEEEHPDPEPTPHDRILLYMYTPDLPALQAQLNEAGLQTGPINHPIYMPSGELCLSDPDGYVVLIGHWGEEEHAKWESAREAKRSAGMLP